MEEQRKTKSSLSAGASLKPGQLIYLIHKNLFLTEKSGNLILQAEESHSARWTVGVASARGAITLTSKGKKRLVAYVDGSEVGLAPISSENSNCEWIPSVRENYIKLKVSSLSSMKTEGSCSKERAPAKKKQKILVPKQQGTTFLFAQIHGEERKVIHCESTPLTEHCIWWEVANAVDWKSPGKGILLGSSLSPNQQNITTEGMSASKLIPMLPAPPSRYPTQPTTNIILGSTSEPTQRDKGKGLAIVESLGKDDVVGNSLKNILHNGMRGFLSHLLMQAEKGCLNDIHFMLLEEPNMVKMASTFQETMKKVGNKFARLWRKYNKMEDAKGGASEEEILNTTMSFVEAREDLVKLLREEMVGY